MSENVAPQTNPEKAVEQAARQSGDGLESRVVDIRRTVKVVKGGRDFNFSATAVVGDRNGRIGYGRGKSKEVSTAIQKANEAARRNMRRIGLNNKTLFYEIISRHGATKVFMKPAAEGTGIIAGGAMRDVFEVLGVSNVLAKIIGSANPTNVIRATINGLTNMKSPADIAEKRGKAISDIIEKKDEQKETA
ncbi:MAG: 30S ribosomal protein S5 [Legionellaceae bacterium]|nr:30S ribosomal protein S5 [Legionellaceae bacterium]|tara:strand:- start:475 stop:1047 length:573 start_codon:yes stop_codon:yes gene_type:complete